MALSRPLNIHLTIVLRVNKGIRSCKSLGRTKALYNKVFLGEQRYTNWMSHKGEAGILDRGMH